MIGEAIVSLLSGGLTGVAGSAISKFGEFKMKKMELANQVALANIETEHIKLEAESRVLISEIEAESSAQSAQDEALKSSYLADKAMYPGQVGIIDGIRGLMRPGITLYCVVLTSWIAFELWTIVRTFDAEIFDMNEVFSLWKEVILLVLYLTTTSVTWWFGTRPATRR